MSYILVIVESPSKCKKIEQYLNKHQAAYATYAKPYKCLASYGHLRELAGLEAIDIHNNFAPTFIECVSKKDQISKLKKALKDAAEVILATDDDREGEAIAWHLCQLFNLSVETTKRLIFHEITEAALHQAIENPTKINMPRVNAQLARQVLDLLVGYKLSPLLWKHVKDGLSAGRCQTPALRLIYENAKELTSAPGKQSYTLTGYFTNMNIPFILNHEEVDDNQLQEFLQVSITHSHRYKAIKQTQKTRPAPEPFNTSAIQQCCSNELHLSPKETMSACQTLYEEGYITYHRTDSKTYCEEFKAKAVKYITQNYGTEYAQNAVSTQDAQNAVGAQDAVGAQNAQDTVGTQDAVGAAHEAIRLTNLECKMIENAAVNKREQRVYQLIRQRTLESCMTEATVSVLNASITAPQNREYQYTAEQMIFPGWKIINKPVDNNREVYAYLQHIKHDFEMSYQKIKAILHLKELKSHYTEARLVQLLEEKGIGRPSTFSTLIEKIQERKYANKENVKGKLLTCTDYEIQNGQLIKITSEKEFGNEKNKLVITPVGILSIEFLLNHFEPLFQYAYTQQMEDALDAVAKGEKIWYEVCKECYTILSNLSAAILDKGKETIRIDANHTYMVGKHGPVIKCINKKEITFKPVRSDLDLNKLRRGEYTLEDIVLPLSEEPASIGLYMDIPVYIKVGKFGSYLEWNKLTKSLKHLKQNPREIELEDVSEVLFDLSNETSATLRIITADACINKGKHGDYIFYKNKKMKKPRFLKLDGFKGDYINCELSLLQEWFVATYKIDS